MIIGPDATRAEPQPGPYQLTQRVWVLHCCHQSKLAAIESVLACAPSQGSHGPGTDAGGARLMAS
jgi:hypothetical protein